MTPGQATRREEALVFDIQRFSLHDGPGIRTTVFFKGCGLRCLWCQNPESQSARPEMAFYAERCLACFRCEAACPSSAILRERGRRIDRVRCDACGLCARACPAGALRRVGEARAAADMASDCARDRDFFDESGGGVTFSGGEPMLRAAFLRQLGSALKELGIGLLLETSGHFDPSALDSVVGLLDLVFFDLKHADPEEHRRLAGAGNGLILANLHLMVERGFHVQPRMPVVPGANDGEGNVRATARALRQAGLGSIHLLPYHALGESKLERIGSSRPAFKAEPPGPARMAEVAALFEKEGIDAVVYD